MSENYYLISDNDVHMPIRCTMQRFDHIRQQMHDYFELSMIVSGSCTLQFDDHMYSLREDDIFCINPLTLHELHGVNCVIITVLFNQTLFEQILPVPSHPRFFCISPMSDNQEAIAQLRSLIAHIIKTNVDKKDGYELRNWSYIYNVMDIMYLHFRVKLSTANEKKNHKYAIRIAEISQLIQQRYTENITLKELADEVHLSVPYLSKFFVDYFGMNFLSYLNQYRLMHAMQELSITDKNIDEVAIDSGFPNSHAFVTLLKKEYGMLPKEYRREQKKEKQQTSQQLEQHNYIAGLKKYLNDNTHTHVVSPISKKQIDFSVNGSSYVLLHTWKKMMTLCIRHRQHGGKSSVCRCSCSCLNRLLVRLSRIPQVNMQVNQARHNVAAFCIDHFFCLFLDLLVYLYNLILLDQDIVPAIFSGVRINHSAVFYQYTHLLDSFL